MTRESPPELFPQRPVRSDFGRRPAPVVNVKRLLLLIGLLVLAVVVGIAVNRWQSEEVPPGEIPTIEAEGEIKKIPDDPGGLDVPHQDVQVFQQLEKVQAAEGGVEHLLPPPETPAPTAQAPQTFEEKVIGEAANAVAPPAPEKKAEPLPSPITAVEPPKAADQNVKAAPVPAVAPAPVKTETPVKAAPTPAPVKKAAPKPKSVDETKAEQAMARLPKELFTGGEIPSATKAEVKQEPAAPAVSSSGKTARAQLASLPDEGAAQAMAAKLQAKYADVLGGLSLGVVRADLGAKGIYYRIMSDPVAEAKAKAICAEMSARKAACLVAK